MHIIQSLTKVLLLIHFVETTANNLTKLTNWFQKWLI